MKLKHGREIIYHTNALELYTCAIRSKVTLFDQNVLFNGHGNWFQLWLDIKYFRY